MVAIKHLKQKTNYIDYLAFNIEADDYRNFLFFM